MYILDNVGGGVRGAWGGGKGMHSHCDHNKHDPDIFNCYTINIHLRHEFIVQVVLHYVLKQKKQTLQVFSIVQYWLYQKQS